MFCTKCGHKNPQEANFCALCGTPLGGGDETTLTLAPDEADADTDLIPGLEDLTPGQGLLVVKRGPNAGSKYLIDQDVVTVGRAPKSEIFLNDVTVSRRHAEIHREGGRFRIKDAGSLNGTYVARERVEMAELANGDEVQVGKFKLLFLTGASGDGGSDAGGGGGAEA